MSEMDLDGEFTAPGEDPEMKLALNCSVGSGSTLNRETLAASQILWIEFAGRPLGEPEEDERDERRVYCLTLDQARWVWRRIGEELGD